MYSIHYTLRQNRSLKITSFRQNKRYKKSPLFSFASSNSSYLTGMPRRSDISVRSHISRDVADHAETSSQRRNRYVNETDQFKTSLRRLIGTWKKLTYLRRHNDVLIDT